MINIPEDLKSVPNWVCWKYRPNPKNPHKPDKVPINPMTGNLGSSTDKTTWGTYVQAIARDDVDGIGFCFSNSEFMGVDIDNCVSPPFGQLNALATNIVFDLNSYTEYSPSGTGIHIIVKANKPEGPCKNVKEGLEMYDNGRYFTMTGKRVPGTFPSVEERQTEIELLFDIYFRNDTAAAFEVLNDFISTYVNPLTDTELMSVINKSKKAEKLIKLWRGDMSDYNDDHSSADLALCNDLAFWLCKDKHRMDAWFRRSALMREKWDEYRGKRTYGDITLDKAIQGCREVYKQRKVDIMQDDSAEVERLVCRDVIDINIWKVKEMLSYNVDKKTKEKTTICQTPNNVRIVLENDPNISTAIRYDMFLGMALKSKKIPWPDIYDGVWGDKDDSALRNYLHTVYGLKTKNIIDDAFAGHELNNKFHPVREFFNTCEWDKVSRVDTLFIDYIGADDTEYVRAVTRKILLAAMYRIRKPGEKFDIMLILIGPQGTFKSTIFKKISIREEWFTESVKVGDMKDKTAPEKLQGKLIAEIGEMAGFNKADMDIVKGFLSQTNDEYRGAYERRSIPHRRQGIIVGTSNKMTGILRDTTGNRRYWPVMVKGNGSKVLDIDDEFIKQIWAEVKYYYDAGESTQLSPELEAVAVMEQEAAMENDDRIGMIEEYLDKLLPPYWDNKIIELKRGFIDGGMGGTIRRNKVCISEVWTEHYGKDIGSMRKQDVNELHDLMARISGWKRYDQSKDGKLRFKEFGKQIAYIRDTGTLSGTPSGTP